MKKRMTTRRKEEKEEMKAEIKKVMVNGEANEFRKSTEQKNKKCFYQQEAVS